MSLKQQIAVGSCDRVLVLRQPSLLVCQKAATGERGLRGLNPNTRTLEAQAINNNYRSWWPTLESEKGSQSDISQRYLSASCCSHQVQPTSSGARLTHFEFFRAAIQPFTVACLISFS